LSKTKQIIYLFYRSAK